MNQLLPAAFLFRLQWDVPQRDILPKNLRAGRLLDLDEHCRLTLPDLQAPTLLVDWRAAWNEAGLGFAVSVQKMDGVPQPPNKTDVEKKRWRIWLDTRATQTVHRATRFCHQFDIVPQLEKGSGKITSVPIARARDDAMPTDVTNAKVWSAVTPEGYQMEVWLPAECLTGFDPAAHRQLGFYGCVIDQDLGEQPLTIGYEFPYENDPSLWQTLSLKTSG